MEQCCIDSVTMESANLGTFAFGLLFGCPLVINQWAARKMLTSRLVADKHLEDIWLWIQSCGDNCARGLTHPFESVGRTGWGRISTPWFIPTISPARAFA